MGDGVERGDHRITDATCVEFGPDGKYGRRSFQLRKIG
jgi:hypothetical protein